MRRRLNHIPPLNLPLLLLPVRLVKPLERRSQNPDGIVLGHPRSEAHAAPRALDLAETRGNGSVGGEVVFWDEFVCFWDWEVVVGGLSGVFPLDIFQGEQGKTAECCTYEMKGRSASM